MADETTVDSTTEPADNAAPAKKATRKAAAKAPAKKATTRKTAAKKAVADPELPLDGAEPDDAPAPAKKAPAKRAAAKKTAAKRTTRKRVADAELPVADDAAAPEPAASSDPSAGAEPTEAPAKKAPAKRAAAKKTAAKTATTKKAAAKATAAKKTTGRKTAATKAAAEPAEAAVADPAPETVSDEATLEASAVDAASPTAVLFQAPTKKTTSRRRTRKAAEPVVEEAVIPAEEEAAEDAEDAATTPAETPPQADQADQADQTDEAEQADEDEAPARRRRRRGGRRRRRSGAGEEPADSDESADEAEDGEQAEESVEAAPESSSSRRRRRRRRAGETGDDESDNPPNTVTKVREGRPLEQQITAVSGSTRLEAKKQRRREGREAGRRRAPIVSEAEFLARRESVERVMVIRQRADLTQIGVLEDKVLVEHYVARESQTSLIGNIYLGRVQNVLPSMEAAFIDIGKGRNAVLYAGEVNWSSLGWREGQPRKIESVLTSGQSVLVQVTKDPIGHKGARLTSQISLAGRFLVYVPDGTTSGISRKLPDTERNRLKSLLKDIVPDTAGVIVRTAAEGASEEELTSDVARLRARWDDIEAKAAKKGAGAQLLYGEPDLTLKVVRDLFTEDFAKLVIQGEDAWDTVQGYVSQVAPDLESRLERFTPGENASTGSGQADAFKAYRIDEQIAKGLDRKVWLPSGGSLIIDRTEAMTVVDVNTGKFTGSGGNLEETVTKNNLEAAEEIVRQLRLRDIGGIIVVDFIDMVLESNRDLVLRRLVECLGRDRTRHQVAEVTSLGLVQMTRKRIGTGLLEAFSENCTHCQGRGIVVHDHPIEDGKSSGVQPEEPRRGRRSRGGRGKGGTSEESRHDEAPKPPSPAVVAAMARHHDDEEADEVSVADEIRAADEVAVVDEVPAVEEATPAEPEEPAKPRVVTRTRRGASRAVVTTGEAAVVEAPVAVAEDTPAAPVVLDTVAAPSPPKVVTRTRRGASRDVTTAVSSPSDEADAHADGEASDTEAMVEHVPVKKRGARKR